MGKSMSAVIHLVLPVRGQQDQKASPCCLVRLPLCNRFPAAGPNT